LLHAVGGCRETEKLSAAIRRAASKNPVGTSIVNALTMISKGIEKDSLGNSKRVLRRRHSVEEKRRVVEETLQPGASVVPVAGELLFLTRFLRILSPATIL
jgi:hypothetical protein